MFLYLAELSSGTQQCCLCCEAPEMICGLHNFTRLSIGMGEIFYLWVNLSFNQITHTQITHLEAHMVLIYSHMQ